MAVPARLLTAPPNQLTTYASTTQVDWPLGLMSADGASHAATDADAFSAGDAGGPGDTALQGAAPGKLRQLLGVGSLGMLLPSFNRGRAAEPGDALPKQPPELELGQLGPLPSFSSRAASREGSVASERSLTESASGIGPSVGSPRSGEAPAQPGRRTPRQDSMGGGVGGVGVGALAPRVASEHHSLSGSSYDGTNTTSQGAIMRSQSAPGGAGVAAANSLANSYSRRSRASQSRFFSLLRPAGGSAQGRLLYGLRVRMGVASGALPADADVRSSAVFRVAKGEHKGPG